jgi:hypothetical protein
LFEVLLTLIDDAESPLTSIKDVVNDDGVWAGADFYIKTRLLPVFISPNCLALYSGLMPTVILFTEGMNWTVRDNNES